MLTLDIVSQNPQLNTFTLSKSLKFASGENVRVIMRLFQPDLEIRHIPSSGAVITVDLKKSDGTILTKTCTFTFADDRSIIEFSLSTTESAQVIGQNLVAKIVDGGNTQMAVLQYGLSKTIPDGSC